MRIVITGANRGIGLALTRKYLERGDTVDATARAPKEATALKEHPQLRVHRLDVRNAASCHALGAALNGVKIDLLINNAGIGSGTSEDLSEILSVIDTNAVGPLRVVSALRDNVCAAKGKIVFISSLMGSIDDNRSGGAQAYRMSKAALNMAGRNVALELRDAGVTAVLVHPGWVKTDMGGLGAPVEVDACAAQLVALADRLTLSDSGKFFNADGSSLPW